MAEIIPPEGPAARIPATPPTKTLPGIPIALAVGAVFAVVGYFLIGVAIATGNVWPLLIELGLSLLTAWALYGLWIYIPINYAVILVNEYSGKQVAIGGTQWGHRLKPSIWAHPESQEDYIRVQRRWIRDRREVVFSEDKVKFTVTYSGNYAPDVNRLIAWRAIEPGGVDEQAEGAFTALIRATSAELNADELQDTDLLQDEVNQFREVNQYVNPDPGRARTSATIRRLLVRWPVADVQLDIEEIIASVDTQQVQEGLRQANIMADVATRAALPKLPKKESVEYKALLQEARQKHTQAHNGAVLPPEDEEIAVYGVLLARLKGLTYEKAFQQAMVITNQTLGINVSGTAGAGVIIAPGREQQRQGRRGRH